MKNADEQAAAMRAAKAEKLEREEKSRVSYAYIWFLS